MQKQVEKQVEKKPEAKMPQGWEEAGEEEIEKLVTKRTRQRAWKTDLVVQTIEEMKPGKVYSISIKKFVELYGLEPVKQLTEKGQKKKIRALLRRLQEKYELEFGFDGGMLEVMRIR